jgi:DNA-binding NtrC family response regulator
VIPVLLVDDDRGLCDTLRAALERRGYDAAVVFDPLKATERVLSEDFEAVVCDMNMPSLNGIELCRRIVEARSDIPVIVLTAFGSFDTAVAAMRAGAYDFLSKPVKTDALVMALQRATEHRRLSVEVRRLRQQVDRAALPGDIVGRSAAMRAVHDLVGRVAQTDASVVITGESGTGKEVVARRLHALSPRAGKPFVAINCAALPETLLESELFGHVRGAFTDAREARTGLLREAEGGTVFLDEIGDMPIGLQPKLLRVLQERTVRPIGGGKELPIDVRLVSATNRDLEAAVEARTFREDLYFRINVVDIALPPLRARGSSDILALMQHFLVHFATQLKKPVRGISTAAAEKLVTYRWPGNVRELKNVMEKAVTLAQFDTLGVDDLPVRILGTEPAESAPGWQPAGELVSLEEMGRRYILHVLESVAGNKAAAARILQIERKTLYRKLEQWGWRSGDDETATDV